MAKALGTIGRIAGIAATVSSFALGPANPVTMALTAVAAVATIGSQLLAKPPPARGSIASLVIAAAALQPYMMGEGYTGGVLRHDMGYGAELNDVPNPYRGLVVGYSGGGPIESITPQVDQAAVSSWYNTFLYTDTQVGATPEASAPAPHFAGLPGWDASSKLSGQAAILWNLKFDKKGKRFASGVPRIGAYGQWTKAYDPRLDDTFPGGSGAHRLGDETTYEWTANPALHAGTYGYGRYQNGKRVLGAGLRSIDWGVIAAWANVCDANEWEIFGAVYEPGNRWNNIKDIAAAGGAIPIISSGGLVSFKYAAPQIALDTITMADLADAPVRYTPMQSWDDRINTIVPRYTQPTAEWEQMPGTAVSVPDFVTADGEEKTKEWPFNLVKSSDGVQPGQLAAYALYDGREINPITIPCLPRMRHYRPGECLTIDLPDYGLELDAIILNRQLDPATLTVTLTLIGETPEKHTFALGQAPAPPTAPVAGQTGQDRDETSSGVNSSAPRVAATEAAMIALSVPVGTLVRVTATGQTWSYNGGTAGTIADWTLIGNTAAPTGAALTRTNDTNVTVTLGGTPATALLQATSLTLGWSGTLAVARGGTGDSGTAWATYTPTVAAFSGTLTSAAATGRWKQIGKTVFFSIKVTITTNGTAAGYVTATLPVAAVAGSQKQILPGKETAVLGFGLAAQIDSGASTVILVKAVDGTYPGANGHVLEATGSYEAA